MPHGETDGAPELVLVHIEVQATRRRPFAKRMFQYFAQVWTKYELPIFPVAVYLRGGRSPLAEEEYRMDLFGREQLRFRYSAVALARFEGREYVEKGGPVAPALAALMSRRRARDLVALRLRMMERLAESRLDEARSFMLLNLVETYFELAGAEREKLEEELSRQRYREVRKMQLTWAEKMEQKFRKQFLREGLLEGKREALLQLLTTKFGPLSAGAVSRVRAIDSVKKLDRYLDRVLSATSLEEMGLED